MKRKIYLSIVVMVLLVSSVFSQSSIASKLQLERLGTPGNAFICSVKFNGYNSGGENLYFEFEDIEGYKGKGYITRNADVIDSYVTDQQTGKLIYVVRSEFVNTSERYIGVSQDSCDKVNEKFLSLGGKAGSLFVSLDTNGNLSFEFTTNEGKRFIGSIDNAVGLR